MTAMEAKAYLHQHYAITEKDYDSNLCKVFENTNSAADVALLLKAGANPDAIVRKDSGQTLAHVACQAVKANSAWGLEVLNLLKVHGADFNKTDCRMKKPSIRRLIQPRGTMRGWVSAEDLPNSWRKQRDWTASIAFSPVPILTPHGRRFR